jgi:hypothetical protein
MVSARTQQNRRNIAAYIGAGVIPGKGAGGGVSLPSFAYQAETLTLIAAQSAVSARRKKSKDRPIARIKAEAPGAWAKFIAIGVIDDTETNWQKNWKTPGTYDLTAVVGPTFTANDGVTTTSNGRYYDTGIPLQSLAQNDHSIAIFSNTSTAVASVEIGAQDTNGNGISINPRDASNKFVARMMSGVYTSPVTTFWSGDGWTGYTRTGATAARIQHNGIFVEAAATASVAPVSNPTIRILGAAGNTGFSARNLSAYYVASPGLTESEELSVCAILRDYIDKVRYGDIDINYAGYAPANVAVDVLVYGCSPAAVIAAYEAKRQGRTVALVGDWVAESDWDLFGMPAAGLGFIDANTPANVSGLFREVLRWANTVYYNRADTSSQFQLSPESRVFVQACRRMLDPTRTTGILPGMDIPVYLSTGLQSVQKTGQRVTGFKTNDGRTFTGRVVIGADYDAQVVPAIGAPYIIGVEAAGTGGEILNGFKGSTKISAPFSVSIDPYVTPGVPASGLLPNIVPMPSITLNAADPALESMNYRLAWANNKIRYAPFETTPPPNYDPLRYEALGRAYALATPAIAAVLKIDGTGLGYTYDVNNGPNGLSTDLPQSGLRYGQTTTDAGRRALFNEIQEHIRGLIYWHLYSGDARIPAGIKTSLQAYSLDPTTFLEPRSNGGVMFWPNRAYVRDPIYRMKNAGFVWSGDDLKAVDGTTPRSINSVSLGNYNLLDRHTPRTVAYDNGSGTVVFNQGGLADTTYGGTDKQSPVPLECLVPDAAVATNFLSPTSPSMTALAWFVDRMEPTLALMGQSAGMIAAMVCETDGDVQTIDYNAFRTRMLATPENVKPILPQVN